MDSLQKAHMELLRMRLQNKFAHERHEAEMKAQASANAIFARAAAEKRQKEVKKGQEELVSSYQEAIERVQLRRR